LKGQDDDIVPIPGTRRIERLKENLAAADVTLSIDDLVSIGKSCRMALSVRATLAICPKLDLTDNGWPALLATRR
jgi:diketogulonate reductase-like aldo/keto reductase